MASAGSIYVDLLLRDSQYVSGLNNSRRATSQATKAWQNDLNNSKKSFESVIAPINNIKSSILELTGVLAGAFSAREIINYSDTYKNLEARLKLATSSTSEFVQVQQSLFDISQETSTPLADNIDAYSRLSRSLTDAQKSHVDLIRVSELLSKTLTISGANADAAKTFYQQFGQAASSDFKAIGQELQTFADQNPRFLKAIQSVSEGTGKTLRKMAEDGELSTTQLLNALLKAGQEIDKEFETLPNTVGKSLTQLDNAFLTYIGNNDAVISGTSSIASAISVLAQNFDLLANAAIALGIAFTGSMVPGLIRAALQFEAVQIAAIQQSLALSNATSAAAEATRMSLALAKAQAAAAGSMSATTIVVGSTGKAVVAAATSMQVFAAQAKNVGLALSAAFGGPIGIAITAVGGAIFYLSTQMNQSKIVHQEFAESISEVGRIQNELKTATEGRALGLIRERNEIISLRKEEIELTKSRLEALDSYLQIAKVATKIVMPGIGVLFGGAGDLLDAKLNERLSAQYIELNKIRDTINGIDEPKKASMPTITVTKPNKEIDKWLIKQRELIETLRQEADYIGKTSIEIDKLKDARDLETQIAQKSYGLKGDALKKFQEEAEAIKNTRQEILQYNYELSRSYQAGADEFFAKYVEDATNSAENIKHVLQDAFSGAEDALVEFVKTGKLNFRDLANSILEDILRIQLRQSLASVTDSISGGLGNILGSVLGGATSGGSSFNSAPFTALSGSSFAGMYADGGYIPPGQWGIAGEAGAEVVMGGKAGATVVPGGGGGNTYYIDAKGADQGAVTRIERSLLALAGPGVIENRVLNAQRRGSL